MSSEMNSAEQPEAAQMNSAESPDAEGTAMDVEEKVDEKEDEEKKAAPWPMTGIVEPLTTDCLFGRGGHTNHHPGNKLFRKRVEEKKPKYTSSARLDKPLVAMELITEWRALNPPGRFLRRDAQSGLWYDVGDAKAKEKACQALRELRRDLDPNNPVPPKQRKVGLFDVDDSSGRSNLSSPNLSLNPSKDTLSLEGGAEEIAKDTAGVEGQEENSKTTGMQSHDDDDDDKYEEKAPFCKCPAPGCGKFMASMRSLYGHYGRSHQTPMNQDRIKFACPFCDVGDDDVYERIFDTTDELKSHIDGAHPNCKLLTTLAVNPTPKKKSSPSSDEEESAEESEPGQLRRSSRKPSPSKPSPSKPSPSSKQQYSHPLCKCPNCDKILVPQGLFGHFGRVHSGQFGGESARFDWKNVSYACPFCPDDEDNDDPPRLFRSFELVEAHVASRHRNCHLKLPGDRGGGGVYSGSSPSAKPEYKSAQAKGWETRKRNAEQQQQTTMRRSQRSSRHHEDDEDDDADSTSSSPGLRKSKRSRRPALNDADVFKRMTMAPQWQTTVKSAAKPPPGARMKYVAEEDVKPLYNCPDCDKKNLTKNGLAAHYGMKHGGTVDWDRVKPVNPKVAARHIDQGEDQLYNCPDCDKTNLTKRGLHAHYGMKHGGQVDFSRVTLVNSPASKMKAAAAEATINIGPWTDEEHDAFLEGHQRYGNRWKQISVEFVPTRDAKQIGSHALNYFSTKGEWQETLVGGRAGGGISGRGYGGKSGGKQRQQQGRQSAGKSRHSSLLGSVISTTMDVDGEESVSMASGIATGTGDDGNSSHCIVCFEGGNIVCCSKCPRAYHPKCLAKDGHSAINIDLLPNDWQCNRCKKDHVILEETEGIPQYAFGNKKIRVAYAEFKDCSDYNYCCKLLSNISDILNKLINYDYGFVFSEPVNVEDVPDYLEVVTTPMDYGTVSERLEGGNYADLIASDDISREDENSTMEEILLHVLCDIEQVHHNCLLYNRKGSSMYRIGDLHSSKWDAYFNQYITERLPDNVQRDLTRFRNSCEVELKEGSHHVRSKKAKVEKEDMSSSPESYQKKRKASAPLHEEVEMMMEEEDDDDVEEEHEHDDESDRDDEDDQYLTSAKNEEDPTDSSSKLLFTEDQVRSLEHVFFSSAAKLRQEEFDASADPTPPAQTPSSALPLGVYTTPHGKFKVEIRYQSKNRYFGRFITREEALLVSDVARDFLNPTKDSALSFEETELLAKQAKEISLEALRQRTAADRAKLLVTKDSSSPVEDDLEGKAAVSLGTEGAKEGDSAPPTESGVEGSKDNADKVASADVAAQSTVVSSPGTVYQKQWYQRLNELKRYKIAHGTAVVSAMKNDKLYHWRSRQRKRYHLTLSRMPKLRKKKKDIHAQVETDGDKKDTEWLLTMPEMKGIFALTTSQDEDMDSEDVPEPFTIEAKDVKFDEKTVDDINRLHQEMLYCPTPPPSALQLTSSPQQHHSSLHSISLFWDECLEELRFFQGANQHTLVPRVFPHNPHIAVWVEIQRAKYLLQKVGIFSGLMGSQMFVMDELDVCNLGSLHTNDAMLGRRAADNVPKSVQNDSGKKRRKSKEDSKPERKSWSTHMSDFKEWYDALLDEDKPKAGKLLPKANWRLYSWCWRQCNATSAVLCGTPSINGINMTAKKMRILASAGLFNVYPYNDRNGLVREDDYEGCDAFNSTFQVLENFSNKYGSTHIPDWYEYDRAFRLWVCALENGLTDFVKGEQCILSIQQIERLILIGFCNDRVGLPNLTRGDVIWLKMYIELKRYCELFGGCHVSSDFPRLHEWIAEQKELFKESRSGKKDVMKLARLKMLMDAGVDFFTGECLPDAVDPLIQKGFKEDFERLTSSPVETFPVVKKGAGSAGIHPSAILTSPLSTGDNYWNNNECRAKFELLKAKNGHSIVLASDDTDVYWWFVERRGKALLSELELSGMETSEASEPNELHSHSILQYITSQRHHDDDVEVEGGGSIVEDSKSMFAWLHYCERLMMFKARMGHCKIPADYPDKPLQGWLTQQKELIYLYSTNRSTELLPVQLKILHSLGLHGCKRYVTIPKLSSRMLKQKHPARKAKVAARQLSDKKSKQE